MKRLKVILCALWILPFIVQAQNPLYNSSLIPKSLLSYASAVVRNEEYSIDIKDAGNAIWKSKRAITILNNKGIDLKEVVVNYDKSQQLKSIKAALYDAYGNLIKKVSASDFEDLSAISSFSLFEDVRLKHYSFVIGSFPCTIEYEYEIKAKQTLFFPDWIPQGVTDIAVEKSKFQISRPKDFQIRVKEINLSTKASEKSEDNNLITEWHIENLSAQKMEPYSPLPENFLPRVKISSVNFSYAGINGEIHNWKQYGSWAYNNLVNGRDILPPATVSIIQELTKKCSSSLEKAQKIYEYVQNKTRYISVQVGIGGLQPMKAEEVDKLGYGDCKALTNYTKSLLSCVGVNSFYAEVIAGNERRNLLYDFASRQSNHVILCVPFEKDSVWLECTSKEDPFGYLGSFTDDRLALIFSPQGGILTKTTSYISTKNISRKQADLTINENGDLSGKIETKFYGLNYDDHGFLLNLSPNDRERELKSIYPVNNLELKSFDLQQQKNLEPLTIETIKLSASSFVQKNNNQFFISINSLKQAVSVPKGLRKRINKVAISRGYVAEDSINVDIPAEFKTEYLPAPVLLSNEFGNYSSTYIISENKLKYIRKLTINETEQPAESYEKLVTFFQTIADKDAEKVILRR